VIAKEPENVISVKVHVLPGTFRIVIWVTDAPSAERVNSIVPPPTTLPVYVAPKLWCANAPDGNIASATAASIVVRPSLISGDNCRRLKMFLLLGGSISLLTVKVEPRLNYQ
jgi:hypothetical protein